MMEWLTALMSIQASHAPGDDANSTLTPSHSTPPAVATTQWTGPSVVESSLAFGSPKIPSANLALHITMPSNHHSDEQPLHHQQQRNSTEDISSSPRRLQSGETTTTTAPPRTITAL